MPNGMAKNNISYKIIEGLPEESIYHELSNIYASLFKDADLEFFKELIKNHEQALFVLAYNDNKLVGFKIGYPYNTSTFYNWIGGVNPMFRKQGIATQLSILQEEYAKKKVLIN